MKCLLCGRKLNKEKSQEIGYGPVCYRKLFGSTSSRQRIRDRGGGDFPYYDIPGQINIEDYLKILSNKE